MLCNTRNIPPSIVLPIQQVGIYYDNLIPERGVQGKLWLIIPSPCIFSLPSTTLSENSTDFAVTVNNIEVTVNTCTCQDVITIITTRDQSGGIYNDYSTDGQGFMALVNKPRPRATPRHLCYDYNLNKP